VTLGNPQTNGRPVAFYGGVFWRAPFETADVVCGSGSGVDAAHGSNSPWLAVLTDEVSLIAAAPDPHWFIRTEGYVGFGPATATESRRDVPVDGTLDLALSVAVIDGRLSAERATSIGIELSRR
jgi:LacI family transcriptional regulator